MLDIWKAGGSAKGEGVCLAALPSEPSRMHDARAANVPRQGGSCRPFSSVGKLLPSAEDKPGPKSLAVFFVESALPR